MMMEQSPPKRWEGVFASWLDACKCGLVNVLTVDGLMERCMDDGYMKGRKKG